MLAWQAKRDNFQEINEMEILEIYFDHNPTSNMKFVILTTSTAFRFRR